VSGKEEQRLVHDSQVTLYFAPPFCPSVGVWRANSNLIRACWEILCIIVAQCFVHIYIYILQDNEMGGKLSVDI
jgi:hypothetical protein